MVAIVSGNNLGLNLSSLASIGPGGQFGKAALGQSGERTYVDVATGNLVVQGVDGALVGLGGSTTTLRTYNSQGAFDQDNGDGWRGAPYRSVTQHGQGPVVRTDIDGSQTDFLWDAARGAYVAQVSAGQALDTISADASGNWVFTDGNTGRIEVYEGSGQGLILSSTDTSGNSYIYSYAGGLLARVQGSDGDAVDYTYVGNNLAQVRTTLVGGTVSHQVDYTYDALNRLQSVAVLLNPVGGVPAGAESGTSYTTSYTYDGNSTRLASVTQADGTALSFTYVGEPGVWRIATVTDGEGKTTSFNYNVAGGSTAVTDPTGVSSVYQYDAKGQLTAVRTGVTPSNAAGLSQVAYRYDALGNVQTVTDALGRSVGFSYDANGNQVGQVDALGNRLERTYDSRNQLLTETVYPQADQPRTTRYVYDAAGRNLLRFVISAEGGVTEYQYNASGLRTSAIVYAGGSYPVAGLASGAAPTEAQLQAWAAGQDAGQTERSDFSYDYRGRLQSSTTFAEVDAAGQGVAGTASSTHYVYDAKGQLLQTLTPSGAGTTHLVYDGLGRQVVSSSAATDGSVAITTLTQYDDANHRATVRLANGLATVSVYDAAGRLVSISQDAGGPLLGTTRYAYDADGRLAMTEDATGERSWALYDAAGRKVADIGADGQLTEYVYDRANRLTETIAYAHKVNVAALVDGAGTPLTQWNANPAAAPAGVTAVTLASLRQPSAQDQKSWNFYDADNRLCFQVDALGQVTQTQYDGASRVTSITRLALPVDVTALGDGVSLELLLGGHVTTTQLSETIQPGGPNAPRILTAQVSAQGAQPTGLVSFYVQDTLLGTAPVVNGVATLVVSNLPAGVDALSAVYGGDAGNLGSTSNTVIDTVAPAYAAVTTLTASTASAEAGASIHLTANVAGLNPSGLVIFYSGTRAIGVASVVGGVATLDVNSLGLGSNVLTAVYQGDAQNARSASAAVTEIVTQASSVTAATATTLLVSDTRSLPGQPVTLTAQVSGATPSGTVDFYNGAQLLGSAALVDGLASLVVASLPVGVDQLTARYAGNATNTASASAPLGVVVLQPTTVSVTLPASPELGAPAALKATVNGAAPGGVVSFYRGSTLLGSAQVSGGVATLSFSGLPLGASSITAVYSGDGANMAGTSAVGTVTVVPAHTTTSLGVSATTIAATANLTLTANVAGTGQPNGPVNFYNNGTLIGTANVVNGVATLVVNTLPVGAARLSASFAGDSGNTASASATTRVTVTTADVTQATLAASASSVTVGSPLTLTASIAGAGTPGGTVTFYSGGTAIGSAAVSGGQASLTFSSLPVGTANLTAVYSGDGAHSASSAGAVAVTVAAAATQISLGSSAASSGYGSAVTLTANLSGGFNASGTVTFFNGSAVLGTATLSNGQASLSVDTLPVGTLTLQASYSGDANNLTSVATFTQTITPATTTTSVSASQTTARQGSAVVLTAQVGGNPKSQPGGIVTFYNGATVLGTATVTNGLAALTVSNLPVGANAITASYGGDARTAASSSAALIETISSAPQATTTSLSASSANVQQGQAFTLTATVTGSAPSGLVTFLNGQTVLGVAAVDGTGTAILTTSLAAKGTFALTATYSGNVGNATSVSAATTVKVTPGSVPATPPAPPATTTTLTASTPNAVRGDPVTLFARVDRSVAGAVPGGTVSFFNGTTLIGSAALSSGQASLTLTSLPVGTDAIRAVYSGDASSATSISTVVNETISLATSSITLATSATSITQGGAVTFTARVGGNVAPSGTVTFYSGATALGTATLSNGLASQTFTSLPIGSDTITARYSGDTNNSVAASSATTVAVTSSPATSTVSMATSPSSVQFGQPVTLTATVRGSSPTGTVSFFNGSLLLGSAKVQSGSAALAVSSLPLGAASLVAVYSGDAANVASTSAAASETVTAASTTTSLTASAASAVYGSPVVLTATVAGSGSPSGTVNFYSGATLLGSATLSNGTATLSVSSLAVGVDSLTASYAGDAGHTASTSGAISETISTAASSLALLTAGPVAPNGDITVRVNGVAPSGTVVFLSGQTVLGTAVVTGGVATLQGTRLPLGSYTLTAAYSGDPHNAPSALDFNQAIVAASTTTTLATASPYVAQNAPLVLTAHVAGSHPGGTVTFYNGSTALGTTSLVNGLAALTIDSLDDGTASLTAVYSGDANNGASMSAALAERVVTAPVNVSVSSSAASVKQGEALTLTAIVSGDNPAGSVAFVAGKITLGSATLVGGVATLVLTSVELPVGARDIVAVYMGDDHNAATTSQALAQTVATGIAQLAIAGDAQDRTITRIEDRDGRLRATIDAEGYLTELRYNAAGHLVETVRYAAAVSGFVDAASIAGRVAQARATDSLAGLLPGATGDDVHSYFLYNARGQKVGEVNGERYLTEFVYDTNGNLTQQIRYATRVTAALPGRLADLRPQSTPQDSHVLNTWDALNRLATQTNAEGTVTAYTYDEIGRLARTDVALDTADQRTMTVRYDVQGRVVAELSPEGAAQLTGNLTQSQIDAVWDAYAVKHTYDAVGRLASTTDANGHRTVFLYDDAGRLRFTVNALGEAQERRYAALGRLEQTVSHAVTVDPAALQGGLVSAQPPEAQAALANLASASGQSASTFHYNVVGRLVESFDAENHLTTFGYNAFDEVVRQAQSVDGLTRLTTSRYDRRGLQVESDAYLAGVALATTSEYDAFGRRTRVRDANGNLHQQSFDRLGRVVQTIDPLNALRSTSYDAFDRVLTQTDALGHSTTYSYDRAQRSVTVTTAEGITMTTAHNREGQTHSVTDGNGNTTTFSYDANGNLLRTDTPLTHNTAEYDKANRLVRTTDANGVVVDYQYDAANRLLTRTLDPSGLALSTHYTYDAKGRQVTSTDARGTVTAIAYDLNGRILTQTLDPAGLSLTTSYTYNEAGDMLTVSSPGGTVTKYVYDELGRRKEEHLDPNGLDLVCRYDYDAKGNLLRKVDANGHATLYTYDADDRLVHTVDATGGVRETRYDSEGRAVGTTAYATRINLAGQPAVLTEAQVRALLQPSAQDVLQDQVLDQDGRVQYTVDGAGGVTRFWRDGNGKVVRQVSYAIAIDRGSWVPGSVPAVGASASDHEVRTAYDALGRAHWVCDGGSVTRLEYDANGNVLLQVRYADKVEVANWDANAPSVVAQPHQDDVQQAVYDAANRALFRVDGAGALIAFKYDEDGNVVERTAFADPLPAGTPLTASALDAVAVSLARPGHDAHIRREYDRANRLTWSVDGMGAVTHQEFDRNGNLVKQVAFAQAIGASAAPDSVQAGANDRVTLTAYDAVNQKTWQVDAMGGVTHTTYDAVGNVVAVTGYATRVAAPGNATDPASVPTLVQGLASSADDRTVRAVFDAANRQVYSIDAAGAVTRTVYDGIGRSVDSIAYARPLDVTSLPLQVTAAGAQPAADAADRQTVRAFDGAGRQVYAVDALGYVSHSVYDALGRVTRQTLHATSLTGGTAAPALSLAGRADLIAQQLQTSAQDRSDSFVYDAAGNLASSTDAANFTESFAYDGLGHKLSFTNKKGDTWTYTYDANGRLLTETSPQVYLREDTAPTAIVTQFSYDALGNLLTRTEALGLPEQRTTSYAYDALGRQVKTIFPPVSIYDAQVDNLLTNGTTGLASRTETAPVALSSEVTYDAFGNAIANKDVAGNFSYKVYDKLGRVTQSIDVLGQVSAYARNTFGDATTLTRYAAALTLPAAGATPDQIAAALQGLSPAGARAVQTAYDRLGRVVKVTEPQTWVHPGPGQAGYYASKVTRTVYTAFGEVQQTGVDVDASTFVATTHYYDRRGQLVASTDPMGYLTTQEYDASGNVTKRTEFANSFLGLPITAANGSADDRITTYEYDALDRKTRETRLNVEHSDDGSSISTAPLSTTYTYDAVGNLLNTTDAMGNVTSSEYDKLGRVTRVLAPARQIAGTGVSVRPETQFFRDAYGNVVLLRQHGAGGAPDRDTRTQYDSHGNAVEVTDAENYQHFMSYNAHGQMVKQWQAVQGNEGPAHTLYSFVQYDALGRQIDVITPTGSDTTFTLPLFGGLTFGPTAAHSRTVYNAFGEVVQRGTYQEGAPVQLDERFEYDDAGRLVYTNSGDGSWKFMLYDVQGFQTAQIASAGGAGGASLAPDWQGHFISAESADGLTVGVRRMDLKVDALGRTLEQHLPARVEPLEGALAPVIYQQFDRWGNVVSQSDPRDSGLVTTFRYDANNQIVQETQPGGITTRVRYDALGRQTAVVDPNGNVNRQIWDGGGQLVTELHADGGQVRYAYNVFGDRERLVDAEGYTSTYAHDRLSRLTSVQSDTVTVATSDGNFNVSATSGRLTTSYTYDAAGRKLTETNGAGETTRFTYDLQGNVIATELPMGQVSRAAFDVNNRQVLSVDADNSAATWEYDHFGKVLGHTDLGGAQHSYAYDNARQLTQQTSTRGQNTSYGYDAAGQLISINDVGIGQYTQYSYDAAGHRTQEYTTQGGVVYQNNAMHYDALGRLDDIRALDDFHITIAYDAAGNKIHQHIEGHGLARSVEGVTGVVTGIDENGSPIYSETRSSTTVFDATSQDLWFAYDAMSRQILVDGVHNNTDLSTSNINSAQGHILTYDRNGNRKTDTSWGNRVIGQQVLSFDESSGQVVPPQGNVLTQFSSVPGVVTEYYRYDAMNRVAGVSTDSLYDVNLNPIDRVTLDTRLYDGAGRLVQSGPNGTLSNDYIAALSSASQANGASTRVNVYDRNGRLMAQHVAKPDGTFDQETVYSGTFNTEETVAAGVDENGNPITYTQTVTNTGPGYDAAGNILGYRVTDSSGVTSNFNLTTVKYESYKEGTVSGFRSDNMGQVRTTTDHYDVNGNLVSIDDDTGSSAAHRSFVNDTNGMVLLKNQQGNIFKQLVVGGELFASYGLAQDPQNPSNYTNQTTFDTNYQPITNLYPSAGQGAYTVRAGDTLQTIAKGAYGDAQLWYLIADANGLRSNSDLRVGVTLNIPSAVGSVHNTSSTFKPYDPSKVIGSTTPDLPVPQSDDDDCGGLGELIMIVVVVVVAYFVGPEVLELLGSAAPAAGGAALTGSAATAAVAAGTATWTTGSLIVAGAVAGAAGSIVSQFVGNALGIVDGFSWKQVALAAISGGVGGGVSSLAGGTGALGGGGFTASALRGALSSALTQGIAVATGLQEHFDWRGVVASGIGAGVGSVVSEGLGITDSKGMKTEAFKNASFGEQLFKNTLTGLASGTTTAVLNGGRIDLGHVAIDAFGNALGTTFGDYVTHQSQQEAARQRAKQSFRRSEIEEQNAGAAPAPGGVTPAQQEAMNRGWGPLTDEAARERLAAAGAPRSSAPTTDEQVGQNAPSAGASKPGATDGPDNYDLMGKMPQVGVAGKEASRGAWGIAASIAGPGASNEQINNIKNQLLTLNPELAKGVQPGQRYYVPDADTPQNMDLARAADQKYQAEQRARYAEKVRADLEAQNAYLNRNDAALRANIEAQFAAGRALAQAPVATAPQDRGTISMPELDSQGNPTGRYIDVEPPAGAGSKNNALLDKNLIKPDARNAYAQDGGGYRDMKKGTYTTSPFKEPNREVATKFESEYVIANQSTSGALQNPTTAVKFAEGPGYFAGAREFGDYKEEAKLVVTGKNSLVPSSLDGKFYVGGRYGMEYLNGGGSASTNEVFGSKLGVNAEGSVSTGVSAYTELKASVKPGSPMGVVVDVGGSAGADAALLRAQGKVELPVQLGPLTLKPSLTVEGQAVAVGGSASVGFKTYETKIGGSIYAGAGLAAFLGVKAKFALDWSFKR